MTQKIALIGFGTVGQGLVEILQQKESELRERYGYEWTITGVRDNRFGTACNPRGLDTGKLLREAGNGRLETHRSEADVAQFLEECDASVVVEMTYTNLTDGEPATTHCRLALEAGRHVVTSNKGPAALHFRALSALAAKKGVRFLIEGTVMSGTPVLNLMGGPLQGCRVQSLRGILNGTTNYILTCMEAGMAYAEALAKAQELGYAEADPTGDVEGFDARAKVTILANVVMGADLPIEKVACKGITAITPEDIASARSQGKRWKLIGAVARDGGGISASVAPQMVPLDHPLAGVSGATNALTVSTDLLGDVSIVGPGAGRRETGFSILTDLLTIHRLG
ncbi:MAG: homoserine dehydrogenase [Acidobacteriota bacterium]|jgi:homoserine dehydrogenase|nr:homoserine dehydrogenase [Acidobacteriota bacterium]